MPVKLDPPPPANSKQPGVTTTLLYNGSRFQGHQKSKGNCYDVEVILQVRNCQIKILQNIWLIFWFISIYELYELWWIFLIRYVTMNNDMSLEIYKMANANILSSVFMPFTWKQTYSILVCVQNDCKLWTVNWITDNILRLSNKIWINKLCLNQLKISNSLLVVWAFGFKL